MRRARLALSRSVAPVSLVIGCACFAACDDDDQSEQPAAARPPAPLIASPPEATVETDVEGESAPTRVTMQQASSRAPAPRPAAADTTSRALEAPSANHREESRLFRGGDIDQDGEVDIRLHGKPPPRQQEGTLSIIQTEERDAGTNLREPVAGRDRRGAQTDETERDDEQARSASRDDVDGARLCYERAEAITAVSPREAMQLCNGSSGLGPAICAEEALDLITIEDYRALELCRCATSAAPVRCYEKAREDTTLSELERVQLCSPGAYLGMDCTTAIRRGPYQ